MKHVIFVDDDSQVLDALRARLGGVQHKWAMYFADTGGAAIVELQRCPYDLIVSDVRMAGMDGARLLKAVAERWPETIRIAMSGHSDLEQTLRLAPVAHQFLPKPCDAEVLKNTIERCFALQTLLTGPSLQAAVGRTRKLPPLRGTYQKLQQLLQNEDVQVRAVADLIGTDTIIAAKVLQFANSAFFRGRQRATTVEQAVMRLGFGTIRRLVLSAEVFAQWPDRLGAGTLDLERLQEHTNQVVAIVSALSSPARTMRALQAAASSDELRPGAAILAEQLHDDAILAALVHDIGYWLLAHECPRELELARAHAVEKNIPLHEAEHAVIGASHAEVGAYLLGIWDFPYPIVEAVAYHHAPHVVPQAHYGILVALASAHALAPMHDTDAFRGATPEEPNVEPQFLAGLDAPFTWEEARQCAAEASASGAA